MKLILLCLIVSTWTLIDTRYTSSNIKEDETQETSKTDDMETTLEETTESTQISPNEVDEESPLDIQVDTHSNYESKNKKVVEEKSQNTEKKTCAPSENCLETQVLRLNSPCDESKEDENLCEKQVKDSECRKGSCACKEGFVNMENLICLPGKRALGESCFLRAQCQDLTPGSECLKGLCNCHRAVLSEKPGEGCIPAMRLGDSCSISQDCNSATKNSVCSEEKKCVCSKHSKVTSNGECILGKGTDDKCISTANECLDENAECKGGVCACKKHYILYEDICVSEKLLNDACQNSKECTVKNSVCQSGKCVCDSEYFSWQDTFCLKANVSEGDSCSLSEQCKPPSLENKVVVCAKSYGSDEESLCLLMTVGNDNLKQSEETSNAKEKNKLKTKETKINLAARSSLSRYTTSKATDLESEEDLEDSSTEKTTSSKVLTTGGKMTTKSTSSGITKPTMESTLSSNLLKTSSTKLSYNNKKLKNKISSTIEAITSQPTTIPTLSTEAISSTEATISEVAIISEEASMSTEATMSTETSILPDDDLNKLYEKTGPEYEEYEAPESPITWKVVKIPKTHYGFHPSQQSAQHLDNNKDKQESGEILKTDSLSSSLKESNNQDLHDVNMDKYKINVLNKETTKVTDINPLESSKSSVDGLTNIESSTNPMVPPKKDTKMKSQSSSSSEEQINHHPMLMPMTQTKGSKSKNYPDLPSSHTYLNSPNNTPQKKVTGHYLDPAIAEMDD